MVYSTSLSHGFAQPTEADWRALAGTDRIPAARGFDRMAVESVYPRRPDARRTWMRTDRRPWAIAQRLAARDIDALAACLRDDGSLGVRILEFAFRESAHPVPGGISAADAADLAKRIRLPSNIRVRIDAGEDSHSVLQAFVGPFKDAALRLWLDPVALLAARGWLKQSIGDLVGGAVAQTRATDRHDQTALIADGRLWHAAGASPAQELGAVVASFVAYLRFLEASRLSLDAAQRLIAFVLAADADQFLTIAKFQAMRLLHARVCEIVGLPSARCDVHAETAWRMMSRRDPQTNLLRATGAAFAAAVGGADSITVLPYDLDGASGPHAYRWARNTQLILSEEAHIAAVADPGAGAGAIEALTDALAGSAWARFQEIEGHGGMVAAIRAGVIQREIATARDAQLAEIARGETTLVGVNAFVTDEPPVGAVEVPPSPVPPNCAETAQPLLFRRLSQSFESEDAPSMAGQPG